MQYANNNEVVNSTPDAEAVTELATAVNEDALESEDPTPMPGGLPALPKTTAVKRLAEALQSHGHSEGAARAIARIVVRPEEARRRLQNPDVMRVKGGSLDTITVQVWTAGVTSFPGNNREAAHRIYPLSGAAEGEFPSLGPVSAGPGSVGELVLAAQSPAHVVSGLTRSNALLAQQNDLAQTIGEHGILRDLMLVVVRIEHEDMTAPSWSVAAADGSSRVTSAHRNQGLGAEQVVYQYPADDRAYRGYISTVLNDAIRPSNELTVKEVSRARSLVAPAKLILGFRPDDGTEARFDQAIQFVVGLTHVEPPKPWGPAAENDALGDAVIEEFLDTRRISLAQSKWHNATISPTDAEKRGFSPYADTRVAEIAATYLPASARIPFRGGVLRITAKGKVMQDFKAKVVAEMALRPWRSTQPSSDPITAVRSTIQRMLTWPVLREDGWHRDVEDPDKLLDEAMQELQARGSSGAAGVELGVRGGYYLAVYQGLVRETTRSLDARSPYQVIQRMTESEHGLRALHMAIMRGRNEMPPLKVDAEGAAERTEDGRVVVADDDWVRGTFAVAGAGSSAPVVQGNTDTPESVFERRRQHVAQLTESLDSAMRSAAAVRGQAFPLVRERGWPYEQAKRLADQLTDLAGQLRLWAAIAEMTDRADSPEDADDEAGEA